MNQILRQILNNSPLNPEERLLEECGELIVECSKSTRGIERTEKLKEEVADVYFCVLKLLDKKGWTVEDIEEFCIEKTRKRFPEQMPEDLSVCIDCTGTDRDSVLNAIFRAYERYKQTKLSYKLLEVEQIQLLGCSRLIIKYNTMAIGFLDENQLTGKTIFHKVGW